MFSAALDLAPPRDRGRRLACLLVRYPLMTAQVIAGIYWQALKLKLRGCRTYTHPDKLSPRSS